MSEDALRDCGVFLRRLRAAAAESRRDALLDDLFDRTYALLVPLFHSPSPSHSPGPLLPRDGDREGDGEGDGEGHSAGSAVAAAGECVAAAASHGDVWDRVGALAQRVVRESVASASTSTSTSTSASASALFLCAVPWRGGSVSAFTRLWAASLSLLDALAAAAPERAHALPMARRDALVAMLAANRALLSGARAGAAVDTLCVAANNFVWVRQQCREQRMDGAEEVEELLVRSVADVLQELVVGLAVDMRQTLQMFTSGGRVTRRVLCSRFAAARAAHNALLPELPRRDVMAILLERILRPLAEEVLDDSRREAIVHGAWEATKNEEKEKEEGDDEALPQGTMPQRIATALELIASEEAFGLALCQKSPTYCTLQRLQMPRECH